MSRPVPNPGILDIAPYTPGKTPVPEPGRKVFKLSANENPYGPPPSVTILWTIMAGLARDTERIGLGVLVSLSKKIREQGGELRLANLNDDLSVLKLIPVISFGFGYRF